MKRELKRMIEAAQDYNEPPETPADEMWAAIRAELPARDRTEGVDELSRRRAARAGSRARQWAPWAVGLAAAATLAVGFGLGRLTQPVPTSSPMAAGPRAETSLPVRMAAAEHLGDAEALLTLFRSGAEQTDRAAAADWAKDLLSTTRLLMDSRVGEDPQMAELLSDLELVLVQIANAPANGDQNLIEEGIEERQLLSKLRVAAAPADISL